jgi:plastocyanin
MDRGRTVERATLRFALVALALVAAACGEPAADREPGPRLLTDTTIDVVGTVSVDDAGFDPDELTVVAGQAVELVNEGSGPHGFDGGEDFDTGLLEPGERTTLVLSEAGELRFTDPAEPDHEGRFVVEPDPDDPDATPAD